MRTNYCDVSMATYKMPQLIKVAAVNLKFPISFVVVAGDFKTLCSFIELSCCWPNIKRHH